MVQIIAQQDVDGTVYVVVGNDHRSVAISTTSAENATQLITLLWGAKIIMGDSPLTAEDIRTANRPTPFPQG